MLGNISWYSFFVLLTGFLIVYYLYVLVRFFRKDILSIMSGKNRIVSGKVQVTNSGEYYNAPSKPKEKTDEENKQESFTLIHELLEEFKLLFQNAAQIGMVKNELIQAIGCRLKTYPTLNETDFIEDLNNHLVMEAKERCNIELFPEDLKRIWDT